MLNGKRILLVISGGIAAYKSLELIRLLKKSGADVRCIVTKGGTNFVTPLSVAAISENRVYTDLFSLKDESEMGHIRLSREADLVLVAPASANLMAQMAYGLAEDLASTTLLATNKPVMICPAMNPMMWAHTATQENLQTLQKRGIAITGPADGDMACGETGTGRMSEPQDIHDSVLHFFASNKPLSGLNAVVTSGPTYEPLDPVRFIGNRSSGKQGHAIATALQNMGANVTLITGPVALNDPEGVKTIHIETAQEMLKTTQSALPADIAICAAAVSDWRAKDQETQKIKKNGNAPTLELTENPDILKMVSNAPNRPALVVGFAAETESLINNAKTKLSKKRCDWVLANNVATNKTGNNTFGSDQNHVYLVTSQKVDEWPPMDKQAVASALVEKIINYFNDQQIKEAAE